MTSQVQPFFLSFWACGSLTTGWVLEVAVSFKWLRVCSSQDVPRNNVQRNNSFTIVTNVRL